MALACLSLSLSAYRSVFKVWSLELIPGLIQASIKILHFSFYMKESLSTMVNLLYLKGTCYPYEAYCFISIALMHSFNPSKDLLISAPSTCLSLLFDLQSCALSEPAKSTKRSLPACLTPSSWILIWQTAWERDEVSLAFVACVVLRLFP
jgi:hypothetical protein